MDDALWWLASVRMSGAAVDESRERHSSPVLLVFCPNDSTNLHRRPHDPFRRTVGLSHGIPWEDFGGQRRQVVALAAAVSVALVPAFGFAQAKQQPASEPVAQAQALYFQLDYVGGASMTTAAVAKGPGGPELRAWNVIHLARSGQPIQAKAAAAAF